jgi:hypothetical protein
MERLSARKQNDPTSESSECVVANRNEKRNQPERKAKSKIFWIGPEIWGPENHTVRKKSYTVTTGRFIYFGLLLLLLRRAILLLCFRTVAALFLLLLVLVFLLVLLRRTGGLVLLRLWLLLVVGGGLAVWCKKARTNQLVANSVIQLKKKKRVCRTFPQQRPTGIENIGEHYRCVSQQLTQVTLTVDSSTAGDAASENTQ